MSRSGTSKRSPVGRRGATAVEMAVVAAAFLLMTLGGLEISRYFFVSESLKDFAGEVARAAVLNPDQDFGSKKAALLANHQILKPRDLTLNVAVTRRAAPALTTVRVQAVYSYRFSTPALSNLVNSVRADVSLNFVAAPS